MSATDRILIDLDHLDTVPQPDTGAARQVVDRAMQLLGYVPGFPSPFVEQIDRSICDEAECSKCWTEGLLCLGYTRRPTGYRVFSCCPACGEVAEW